MTSRRLTRWPQALQAAWQAGLEQHLGLPQAQLRERAWACRASLRESHLDEPEGAFALGFVAAAAHATLGLRAHDTQGFAASLMLRGHLAEMATGEGKTLATGLAAATAALAGLSVHVMTANDYLVQRDRQTLSPLFGLLGLDSAAIVAGMPAPERHAAYRRPIVYVTAREVVFDHLKDHLQTRGERDPRMLRAWAMGREGGQGEDGGQGGHGGAAGEAARPDLPPRLPGAAPDGPPAPPLPAALAAVLGAPADGPLVPRLQQAFLDEADSILLDEASIPFILSLPGAPPDPAALQAAREAARGLRPGDYRLQPARRTAELTPAGVQRLAAGLPRGGPLWPLRHAAELVRAVLVAEHLLVRDRDYAVVEQGVQLIDDITGRIAAGRQWSHPLHAMVELKEGREPTAPLHTAARVTYQRFFPRYERLGGMSGTLAEAGGELRAMYRCPVVPVPRAQPSRARWLGRRLFADGASRLQACVARTQALVAQRRPVLIGTDSVQASRALSARLDAAGIAHQVLNAVQDAEEAELVAQAGLAGRVTVTTNMAGRGTDIRPDAAALAAGGLHVILALGNRSRRVDRQLAGRAARHGDPGSAEALLSLDDVSLAQSLPAALRRRLAALADADGELPAALAPLLCAWAQRRGEWRERLQRRDLQLLDEQLAEQLAFAGTAE